MGPVSPLGPQSPATIPVNGTFALRRGDDGWGDGDWGDPSKPRRGNKAAEAPMEALRGMLAGGAGSMDEDAFLRFAQVSDPETASAL